MTPKSIGTCAREQRERRLHTGGDVLLDQRAEVDRREEIAVHDEQALEVALDLRERACGAERLFLAQVVQVDAEAGAVAEVGLDQLREVADGQVDMVEAGLREPAEQDLEHGHLADRHQRLRQHGRVGGEARPLAAREHDDFDRARRCRPPAGRRRCARAPSRVSGAVLRRTASRAPRRAGGGPSRRRRRAGRPRLSGGRTRSSTDTIEALEPRAARIFSASSPIEISVPVPRFSVSPSIPATVPHRISPATLSPT